MASAAATRWGFGIGLRFLILQGSPLYVMPLSYFTLRPLIGFGYSNSILVIRIIRRAMT